MTFFMNLLNLFSNKQTRFFNSKAKDIMINSNDFDDSNLTLGNIYKVNENILIRNFKNKIINDNLTVAVINNKGKIIGYISKNELNYL